MSGSFDGLNEKTRNKPRTILSWQRLVLGEKEGETLDAILMLYAYHVAAVTFLNNQLTRIVRIDQISSINSFSFACRGNHNFRVNRTLSYSNCPPSMEFWLNCQPFLRRSETALFQRHRYKCMLGSLHDGKYLGASLSKVQVYLSCSI